MDNYPEGESVPLSIDQLRQRTTITITEAGELLGLSRNTAYAAAKRGDFPTLRIGGRVVVPVPALLTMLGIDDGHDQDPRAPEDSVLQDEVLRLNRENERLKGIIRDARRTLTTTR